MHSFAAGYVYNMNTLMNKRFYLSLLLVALISIPANAQKKGFSYSFYGFVRGDLFYNSRMNEAPVDGDFYMYPLDKLPDADGKDINARVNGSFYSFTTRLGMDIKGPAVGTARTSAKIETDFGGFSASTTMLRIRQAYVALDWENSQLLVGHTWHPLTGDVMPDVLNLSTGAPFNPFNRSPMLRYRRRIDKVQLTAAAVWQLQYTSSGPSGASEGYIKNSGIPEIYLGAGLASGHTVVGAGAHLISLVPRTVSPSFHKVNERVTGLSYEAYFKHTGRNYMVAAKTMLNEMTDHSAMLGGYAVSHTKDIASGEYAYTPFRHTTSWVNFTYGTTWKAGIFGGYTKNLGTSDALDDASGVYIYGKSLNIDRLYTVNPSLSYNLPHWKLGVEYSLTTAHYGAIGRLDGKVTDTHAVTNHRVLGLLVYFF